MFTSPLTRMELTFMFFKITDPSLPRLPPQCTPWGQVDLVSPYRSGHQSCAAVMGGGTQITPGLFRACGLWTDEKAAFWANGWEKYILKIGNTGIQVTLSDKLSASKKNR